MQPAPLTGTATFTAGTTVDHNVLQMQPAPLTGTATTSENRWCYSHLLPMQPAPLTGTATNIWVMRWQHPAKMQPAPLAGTATAEHLPILCSAGDAARTPRGDSNFTARHEGVYGGMQPAPLTGTATLIISIIFLNLRDDRCSPLPSRGQQLAVAGAGAVAVADAARTPHGDSNWKPSKV